VQDSEQFGVMAGASDKARFYLEQSIPELQEYERKKIFSKVHPVPTMARLYLTTAKGGDHLDYEEAV